MPSVAMQNNRQQDFFLAPLLPTPTVMHLYLTISQSRARPGLSSDSDITQPCKMQNDH